MKLFVATILMALITPILCAQQVSVLQSSLQKQDKEVIITLQFPAALSGQYSPADFVLSVGQEQLVSSQVTIAPNPAKVALTFAVNSASFVILEGLVSDNATTAVGYAIKATTAIQMQNSQIAAGILPGTQDAIPSVSSSDWNKYILGEYASHYLFPQLFHIGTQINPNDSADMSYYVELQESKPWASLIGDLSLYWGIEGRISTSKTDSLAYAKIYPIVAQLNGLSSRGALMAGVETGYEGFGKQGRATLKGVYQFRLPYNPINLTMGFPRWRINPVVDLAVQGSAYWSNVALPDSLKNSFDATLSLRYDIPVGKNYYLQTSAQGNYSTLTKELQYMYDFSFGYIVDGSIQVLATYRQGYQDVSYSFDKQLLLGIAINALNSDIAR